MDVKVYGSFDGPVADADADTNDVMTHPALPGLSIGVAYVPLSDRTKGNQLSVFINTEDMADEFHIGGIPVMQVLLNDSTLHDLEPGGDPDKKLYMHRDVALSALAGSGADCYEALAAWFGIDDDEIDAHRAQLERPVTREAKFKEFYDLAPDEELPPKLADGTVKIEEPPRSKSMAAAGHALMEFVQAGGGDPDDPDASVRDLITDVLHVARSNGSDADKLAQGALDRYEEEKPLPVFAFKLAVDVQAHSLHAATERAHELADGVLTDPSVVRVSGAAVRPVSA